MTELLPGARAVDRRRFVDILRQRPTPYAADATLVVADGMPLIWASHLQGTPLPERVAGSDLISSNAHLYRIDVTTAVPTADNAEATHSIIAPTMRLRNATPRAPTS